MQIDNTINEKLHSIELQIQELKLNTKNINDNQEKHLLKLENDISPLKNQIILKNNIDKDIKNIKDITNRQDGRISDIGLYLTISGILMTMLVLYFSITNKGVAKSIAEKEIKQWLDEDLKIKFDQYIKKLEDEKTKMLENIQKKANQLNQEHQDIINELDKKNYSPKALSELDKQSETINKQDSKTLEDWHKLFLNEFLKGNYEKAIEYIKEAIRINPKDDKAYYNMGITYAKKQDYDNAISSYKKAIEINPKKDEAYYNMGIAYGKKQDYDNAISSYKKTIEINPKSDNAYYNMGIAYGKKQDYDNAISSYKKTIEINPKSDNAYYNMGIAYDDKQDYDNAISSYKKAIEINPKSDNAYYNMGIAYGKKQDYDNAISSYKKAIEINPKSDNAYYNMVELSIIQNKILDDSFKQRYKLLFEKNYNIYIKFEMLNILQKISKNETAYINKWFDKYKSYKLGNFSFDELEEWANSKDNPIKENLFSAINQFKSKL